jgi:hypothetical protein
MLLYINYYLIIVRVNEDGSWTVVWKNEPVMNNLNPKFPASRIKMMPLCNGDIDRPLRVALWDYESDGIFNSIHIYLFISLFLLTIE